MNKELVFKKKGEDIVIAADDLKFDSKHLLIPGYYADIILEYIQSYDVSKINSADKEDFLQFKKFLNEVEDYRAERMSN